MLENKLGIIDDQQLAEAEERLSKQAAKRLFDSGLRDQLQVGVFDGLKRIHEELFNQVYSFAGQLRTVNIAKGSFNFAPALYLPTALAYIDTMPQDNFEHIIEKYVEMNVAHPFSEGNGRSTRLWLDCILRQELGLVVDWSLVDREDYLLAMERSPIKDIELKYYLKKALSDRINDRELYLRGIDSSWYYEGYKMFKTSEI